MNNSYSGPAVLAGIGLSAAVLTLGLLIPDEFLPLFLAIVLLGLGLLLQE